MDAKTKRQTLKTFYFIFSLFALSAVMIDPLIPIIAEQINVGFDKIGIALFIGSIATLVSNFIAGRLSDRIDIKKLVLFGLVLLLLGFTLFGIYLNYILFVIVLILIRIGFGTVDTTIHSFSAKLYKKDISKIFLNLDIAWFLGAFLGPLIISAILFFDFLPRYLFFITAFTYLVSIIIFYRICPKKKIPENNRSNEVDKKHSRRKGLSSLKDPAVIVSSLVLFFYIGAVFGMTTWLTTYFLDLGIRVAFSSAILSGFWLFSILGIIITKRLASRLKEISILFYSFLAGTICLALFSFIPNLYIKIVVFAIQAIFFAGVFPLTTAIAAQRDQDNSGTILGFVIALAFAGSIVFQPVFGYVAEYFGKNYIVFIALGGTILGLIFTFILFLIIRKKPFRVLGKD